MKIKNEHGRDEELERIISPLRSVHPDSDAVSKWKSVLYKKTAGKKRITLSTVFKNRYILAWTVNAALSVCLIILLFIPLTNTTRAGHLLQFNITSTPSTKPSLTKVLPWFFRYPVTVSTEDGNTIALLGAENHKSNFFALKQVLSETRGIEKIAVTPVLVNDRRSVFSYAYERITGKKRTVSQKDFHKSANEQLIESGFTQGFSAEPTSHAAFNELSAALGLEVRYNGTDSSEESYTAPSQLLNKGYVRPASRR
jgi:hypothetical protein